MIATKAIEFAEQELILSNQRALFWPKTKQLILSDTHFGKTNHFRQYGIAIPSQVAKHDLIRLTELIHFFDVKSVVVVGDLFHSTVPNCDQLFLEWKSNFPHVKITLIKGNHDRFSDDYYQQIGINTIKNDLTIERITFIHDLVELVDDKRFTISGHVHPGFILEGKAKQRLKFPAFIIKDKQHLILPAFSQFTGLNTRVGKHSSQSYILTHESVIEK